MKNKIVEKPSWFRQEKLIKIWIWDSGGDVNDLLLIAPISWDIEVQVTERDLLTEESRREWRGLELLTKKRLWVQLWASVLHSTYEGLHDIGTYK